MPCGGVVSGGSPGEFLANSERTGGGFRVEGGWIWGELWVLFRVFLNQIQSVQPQAIFMAPRCGHLGLGVLLQSFGFVGRCSPVRWRRNPKVCRHRFVRVGAWRRWVTLLALQAGS